MFQILLFLIAQLNMWVCTENVLFLVFIIIIYMNMFDYEYVKLMKLLFPFAV